MKKSGKDDYGWPRAISESVGAICICVALVFLFKACSGH